MKNRMIVGINRKSKNRGRVGMDNVTATGFGIVYVAEEAYPLIPYVRGHVVEFGRAPRLLSILFTTFVNTQNADAFDVSLDYLTGRSDYAKPLEVAE